MEHDNLKILNEFTLQNIPDLDVAVLGALEFFQDTELPRIDLSGAQHPLVVGSGNAEIAGRIIFRNTDAVFASESNCEEKLASIPSIDRVVLVSAFAGKHAPAIVDAARKHGKKVTLITAHPSSLARKKLDMDAGDLEYVFPRTREPYTYNTSTYLGMLLSVTGENPKKIYDFINEKVATMDFSRLAAFDKFFLIVPGEFSEIRGMFHIKFKELFGRQIARDVETMEFMGHATTVVPAEELFICIGVANELWGKPDNRIFVPLPPGAGYASMMAIGYYVIGQIQRYHEPYFKENIGRYTEESSKIFGHEIKPIVE